MFREVIRFALVRKLAKVRFSERPCQRQADFFMPNLATCELKKCLGYYVPFSSGQCFVSAENAKLSKEKYGMVICKRDMELIEKNWREKPTIEDKLVV